jgi:purine-binding chemotaxis protein CheW
MSGVLCVYLNNRLYGIKISEVIEIVEELPLTELFRVPDFIEGVANLRGRIFTVINFAKFVNLSVKNHSSESKKMFIVLQIKSGKEAILTVSKIKEVKWLAQEDFHDLPDTIDEREKKYLKSVIKTDRQPIPVIDMNKLLEDEVWQKL